MSLPSPSSAPPLRPILSIPASQASPSVWDRISSWVSENKVAVYTIAGVVVVVTGAGVVYYNSTSDPKPAKLTKKDRKRLRDAAKSEKSKKSDGSSARSATSSSAPSASVTAADDDLPEVTEASLAGLSASTRKEYADRLKKAGNKAYGDKNYPRAIDLYTRAILCKSDDSIFYSNRAACYSARNEWDKVIEDTTAAIAIDSQYVKALNRRAHAYDKTGRYREALLDYTTSCIIDNFRSQANAESVERLLRRVAEDKAKEMMAARSEHLPSHTFVRNYLQSFRTKPRPAGLEDSVELSRDTGKGQLQLGLLSQEKRTAEGYEEARQAFEKALQLGDLGDYEALAYNMRGTFRCLVGKHEEAMEDVTKSIELDDSMTQSYIKRASMNLELGRPEEATADFQTVAAKDPNDPDVYYHRAQLHFIKSEFNEAAKDYQKSIDLDRDFIFSHIQLGVTQYKMGSVASSMATFRRCVKNFPDVPDVYNYYGELLLDQGNFNEAIEKFDEAIKIEKSASPMSMNVLPLINKALAIFQWKQDFAEAEGLCQKALIIDPECDIAVATMAQLLLQQGKTVEALKYFRRAAEIARTEGEIVNALSYAEATSTQLEVQEKYPELAAKLAMMNPGAAAALK
ncbi:Mitochondrial import receptor subunit tom70 [Ceratocystis fimbriata CBS 114723]|uniref:Mitochondrial import receptor subunit tom70 n=1 Tax=Ceratocystis fimbriata CBS 114723 TaxID=1035309 RepID=A0A2C5XBY6_9PEZI|nr:Mitochondrial import receptor subunit tom70 [Ceratocystis fimbriata CBS 114723]